jgi:hypothetical protein
MLCAYLAATSLPPVLQLDHLQLFGPPVTAGGWFFWHFLCNWVTMLLQRLEGVGSKGAAAALATMASPAFPAAMDAANVLSGRSIATSCTSAAPGPSEGEESDKISQFEEPFGFIRHNVRPAKPRSVGLTEMRGPYYVSS